MDKDLDPGEAAVETAAPVDQAARDDEPEAEGPVVLADAMCGAFCSIKGETRPV